MQDGGTTSEQLENVVLEVATICRETSSKERTLTFEVLILFFKRSLQIGVGSKNIPTHI